VKRAHVVALDARVERREHRRVAVRDGDRVAVARERGHGEPHPTGGLDGQRVLGVRERLVRTQDHDLGGEARR
jgi:hypothetical protein